MSRSRESKGETRADPLFGEVRYDGKGAWVGSIAFAPVADTISILVASGVEGPTDGHREAFRELTQRYDDLSPAIATALFELFSPYLREPRAGRFPKPASPDAIWGMTILDWVLVEGESRLKLGYGFIDGSGWDDAMFTVKIEGWVPTGESLDD